LKKKDNRWWGGGGGGGGFLNGREHAWPPTPTSTPPGILRDEDLQKRGGGGLIER